MASMIKSMKFSANVPDDVMAFMDEEVKQGHYPSRSAALTEAMSLWRTHKLGRSYAESFQAVDSAWDEAVADGLDVQDPS